MLLAIKYLVDGFSGFSPITLVVAIRTGREQASNPAGTATRLLSALARLNCRLGYRMRRYFPALRGPMFPRFLRSSRAGP